VMMIDDPYANKELEVGDMVQHPMSGHVGLITGKNSRGMWLVEWFANNLKGWNVLEETIQSSEYDSTLYLLAKAENA